MDLGAAGGDVARLDLEKYLSTRMKKKTARSVGIRSGVEQQQGPSRKGSAGASQNDEMENPDDNSHHEDGVWHKLWEAHAVPLSPLEVQRRGFDAHRELVMCSEWLANNAALSHELLVMACQSNAVAGALHRVLSHRVIVDRPPLAARFALVTAKRLHEAVRNVSALCASTPFGKSSEVAELENLICHVHHCVYLAERDLSEVMSLERVLMRGCSGGDLHVSNNADRPPLPSEEPFAARETVVPDGQRTTVTSTSAIQKDQQQIFRQVNAVLPSQDESREASTDFCGDGDRNGDTTALEELLGLVDLLLGAPSPPSPVVMSSSERKGQQDVISSFCSSSTALSLSSAGRGEGNGSSSGEDDRDDWHPMTSRQWAMIKQLYTAIGTAAKAAVGKRYHLQCVAERPMHAQPSTQVMVASLDAAGALDIGLALTESLP
jgi:hypothetical protein